MDDKRNVLVLGSGGREHTLSWKIAQSSKIGRLFCAPGNGGIADSIDLDINDFDKVAAFCMENNIDLVVIGPEQPLVEGLADELEERGIMCFGPSSKAALLEGSKAFAKHFMKKFDIPTARYETFEDYDKACDFVKKNPWARVIKASGLAAGKGVIVCDTQEGAIQALDLIMLNKKFKDAGNIVVIEERLEGEEASLLAFTDGETIKCMVPAQDHKRVFDDDKGPNTGGMGAYAPAPVIDSVMKQCVYDEVLLPTVKGMAAEGREYKGVLYAGLMITQDGPKVIEFNCRFGDPETQVVVPLLASDIVEVMEACARKKLDKVDVKWHDKAACTVVLAAGGYPEKYDKGLKIQGEFALDKEPIVVFHAGTKRISEGNEKEEKRDVERDSEKEQLVTNGGRVMAVTALAKTVKDAIDLAYSHIPKIKFEKMHYRKDIGKKALERLSKEQSDHQKIQKQ